MLRAAAFHTAALIPPCIDIAMVSGIVSYAYASRQKILPLSRSLPARSNRRQPQSSVLHSLIGTDTGFAVLRAGAIREGVQSLRLDGTRKVNAGLTAIDEVA